jgi:tetratricopeptide (TPR) repeat protein
MQNAILGAGPAGLYAAIRLYNAGLRNIVIYDPRAGIYTRPGHLNSNAYLHAQNAIANVPYDYFKTYHIKDLERVLYAEVLRLGIPVEKKGFIRLHQDASAPGIVVKNSDDQEEIIPAAYVFDATGAKRCVVDSLNKLDDQSTMNLIAMTKPPVKTHFLAYVQMTDDDFNALRRGYEAPDTTDAEDFTTSILNLRALGWNEMKFPRCYGANFGKNKYCLYLHAPNELAVENYENWVQTVLHCYAKTVTYQHIKSSKKYPNKPRFGTFQMNADALQEVSYAGKNLPTVIALGDAQIDFDYVLAHGVLHGLQRIDSLMDCIEILDGKIAYFESDEYASKMHLRVSDHKQEVIGAANALSKSFDDAISPAQVKLKQAKMHVSDDNKRVALDNLLQELDVRQCYLNAMQQIVTLKGKSITAEGLKAIHYNLLKAYTGLPTVFSAEKEKAQEALKQIAVAWKDVGNGAYKKRQLDNAIEAYKKALEVHELLGSDNPYNLEVLALYSNLTIVYKLTERYEDAIAVGNMALELHENLAAQLGLKEKIVFNLVAALCAQAHNMLKNNRKDAQLLHTQARGLVDTHKTILDKKTLDQVERFVGDVAPLFVETSHTTALDSFEEKVSDGFISKTENPMQQGNDFLLKIDTEELPVTAPDAQETDPPNVSPNNVSQVGIFSIKKRDRAPRLLDEMNIQKDAIENDKKSDTCELCIIL